MRATAAAAWPAMCRLYEGVTTWMYLDVKGLVTTGVGFLIDSVSAAQALPWLTKLGATATEAQVETEWRRVKALTKWQHLNGLNAVWSGSAVLHLSLATVDSRLAAMTPTYWAGVVKSAPNVAAAPADAQLALIDEAWQNGGAFLDLRKNGAYVWAGTRAAVLAQDWAAAASHVPGTGARADRRKRLFSNAAAVVRLGLDPAVLWDTKTPTAPVVVTPTPDPTPEVPDVAKVKFRGGWTCSCVATSLPLVEQDLLRRGLIKHNVDIYQLGYRDDVSASAGTHAAGGNTDVAQFSDAQIDVWRLWGWTIQHRTKAQGFDMDHGHGWPLGCTHLSAGGKSQAAQWANRQNGLASKGRVSGRWPIDNWKTAMKKRLAEIAADETQKELELPTTSEVAKALASNDDFLNAVADAVLGRDAVPNEWADKTGTNGAADNPTISVKTSLRRADKQILALSDKLDALIARFPSTPPPAA